MPRSPIAQRRIAFTVTSAAVALVTALTTATNSAAGPAPVAATAGPVGASGSGPHRGDQPDFDARAGSSASGAAEIARRAALASSRTATRALGATLGAQALVDLDGTTLTVRMLARLDGYLTEPSAASAGTVAMDYVQAHLGALGLTAADLPSFRLTRDYRDIDGTHHLTWTQSAGGVDVFGNGLQAAVTKNGQLLSLGGSPISGLKAVVVRSQAVASKNAAIAAARGDLGESTTPGPRDVATPMLFVTAAGAHLGWRVVTMSAAHPATTVVDSRDGTVLYRKSLASDANPSDAIAPTTAAATAAAQSTGIAYRYFPKHMPNGGVSYDVNYSALGWLPGTATILAGNNSHTYSDVNDDNVANPSEEVPPQSPHTWDYRLKPFALNGVSFCNNPYPCSWNPNQPFSWQVNRKQDAAQVFFFVNNWHDHLLGAPIGFTEAAGNFQVRNYSGQGQGGDAVDTQTDDGANTADGLPDGAHLDNANMDTPPDGQSPRMQMYLQHEPGTSYPGGDPFAPTNVGDEADTVYHEYTHGLSNRLVIDATGGSALGPVQGGSMGEAWSDWYAMDYLVRKNLQSDVKGKVDVVLFQYDGAGVALDRTEPVDCKVGSTSPKCGGGATGHLGGYTYADFGRVIGRPEVHADGEIWSQTLWDLRDSLGSTVSESLVTRAMELSPVNPSYLDERNAILLADTAGYGGRHRAAIWSVFAHRGMGYFAGSLTGSDSTPAADFHAPPTTHGTGVIRGRILNADTHKPAAGVTVALAFEGAPGVVNPAGTSDKDGRYQIGPVPVGTYGKLAIAGGGYDPVVRPITVKPAGATANFTVRRDWAAASGGATVTDFNGPDYSSFGCGPTAAIDQSQASGWGSTTGDDDGTPTNVFIPKRLVIKLPSAVDITTFTVDPSAACGDDPSSSTGDYTIETSGNGRTWTAAAHGTFTGANNGRLNPVPSTDGATAVSFIRFTILSNQTPNFATACPKSGDSGCSFSDLTEMAAYGVPAG
jgi:extracellular elastinolytic metalloproteinase